ERMSEINLEFLLGAMPMAEATLYRVLIQLIPAPSAESTVAASRQIKLQLIAERTGFSKRWVIELLQRLEEKNFIRTEGGSGAVQWIRLLPLGVPLLGGSEANQSSRKQATSPEAKAPRAAARRPKRRRQANGANPESGCRSQRRPARRETGGDSRAAPESTDCIDPASRSGTRRPGGACHRGDTASTTGTSRSDVARRYDAASAVFNVPRRPGARQSSGNCHHGDTSPFKGTRRPGARETCGARHQDRATAFHGPRRPYRRQRGGARRHDAASDFSGPGRPGGRQHSGDRR